MGHLIQLSEKEREMLNTMKELVLSGFRGKTLHEWDVRVAMKLNIAEATVRSRRSRLKSKYEYIMDTAKKYRSYQQFFYQKTGGKFNPLSRSGQGRK